MAKEIVAMILAGGRGSRLYALTQKTAKPAVSFGGKYRIVDFPLSNCVNSNIDTVGIATQYQPQKLNEYIGNGQPWDLDRLHGGVHTLPPYEQANGTDWYKGTANAIYQNIGFIDSYNPEYVIILSGDQICKQDYADFLRFHKEKGAEFSVAVMEVDWKEASRFGLMVADENDRITEFQEKPPVPKSNLASMGIYIFNWDVLKEHIENQNKLQEFEWEKWEVAAKTDYYPVNGVAQALYRIYQSQYGDLPVWHEVDAKVRKILNKCVEKKIDSFPNTRHRVIAWSCAPLYYSNWCTWAYNCWGLNVIINMDSLMFDMTIRTDTYEHCLEDMAQYHMWAPMRRMAVGGMKHFFELWEYKEKFNCDMVMMYDQLQCKGAQGLHGLFEDEFRDRNIPAIWMPHALPDSRTVSRMEIRRIINDYMSTVMHEEPLDPSLLDFDDSMTW